MERERSPLPGPSRTLTVLRVALTVAWLWISASALLSPRVRQPLTLVISSVCLVVFLAALWWNLRRVAAGRTTPLAVVLLAVQVATGIAVATDLMMLVALELPLVLRPRHAVAGFVVLVTSVMLLGLALARAGAFAAAPELAGMRPSLQVLLTLGGIAGWQLLAFSGGLLAATEIRSRHEVGRLMAELQITNRLLEASSREAERLHIARELHDTVGHRLAALGVHLDLESRRAEGRAAASLREARDSAQQLLGEVREVVGTMRQERPLDLKRAIAELLGGIPALVVELTLSPGLDVRDPARAHALLRCAQEALTNVLRHARASRAWLDLRQDARGVTLRVRDDGRGASSGREGHGLRGMRERLEALGGRLEVGGKPGEGFEIVAWLPLGEEVR